VDSWTATVPIEPKNAPMSAAKTVAITSPPYDWLAALPSSAA
jgi:hypothetical protein